MSQITKRAFAASLKKLLKEKPLDKIKITDLYFSNSWTQKKNDLKQSIKLKPIRRNFKSIRNKFSNSKCLNLAVLTFWARQSFAMGLSCALQGFQQPPWMCLLDVCSKPPSATSKNISRHCQVSPRGQNHLRLKTTGLSQRYLGEKQKKLSYEDHFAISGQESVEKHTLG